MSFLYSSYLKALKQICLLTFPLFLPVTLEEQVDKQRSLHTTAPTNQQQIIRNQRRTSHRSRTAFTTHQSERLEKGDHFSLSLSAQSHLY